MLLGSLPTIYIAFIDVPMHAENKQQIFDTGVSFVVLVLYLLEFDTREHIILIFRYENEYYLYISVDIFILL